IIFFFSSRRRHTRFSRDWSSDVCSSDLQSCHAIGGRERDRIGGVGAHDLYETIRRMKTLRGMLEGRLGRNDLPRVQYVVWIEGRSEERRVGKECRERRAPSQERIERERR